MNLPNKLTLGRIFLIPVFMFFLLVKITYGKYLAAFIFILAASTDGLDGYIARKRKQITNFGKIMDPLADKLLVTAALVSLVQLGEISAWPAFIILGREFAITGLRSVAAAEGVVVSASYLGKVKTVTQIIAISLILLEDFHIKYINFPIGEAFLYIALFFTIWSGVDYVRKLNTKIKIDDI